MSNDTDQTQATTNADGELKQSPAEALAALKARADLMGVKYHPNIGFDALSEKVAAALEGKPEPKSDAQDPAPAVTTVAAPKKETEGEKRNRIKRDALALVRVRVTCLNPAKKEWEGEIFAVGNSLIGTVKRYVPFNNDEGWHVEQCLVNMIKARECQIFVTKKDERGNSSRVAKNIKEFSVEIMDPLTKDELAELARRQAASKSID